MTSRTIQQRCSTRLLLIYKMLVVIQQKKTSVAEFWAVRAEDRERDWMQS
jgi:hypothetical protein